MVRASSISPVDRTFNVTSSRIVPSLIKVDRRLTYDTCDQLLELGEAGDRELYLLYQIALTREMLRFEQGGFKVHKRDVLISVSDKGRVSLIELDEHGPARSLIGEMMILANELFAHYASDNEIPIIYRGQSAPDPEDRRDPDSVPPGPAQDYAMRAGLKPSQTSLDPAPHATLGINAYTQATSPIRRYTDLITQRQILWHLRGHGLCYSRAEIEAILPELDAGRTAAGSVTKETKRFWLLRYLQQRLKHSDSITGTVIRTDLKTPLVELDEVCMATLVKFKHSVAPGDEVTLRITRVDPAFDDVRLEPSES